jgi:hypothetical protein
MSGTTIVLLVLGTAAFSLVLGLWSQRREQRSTAAALRAASAAMRAAVVSGNQCIGRLGKHRVTLRLGTQRWAKSSFPVTEVDVACGPLPVALELRPQRKEDRRLVRLALTVDVETGDRAFDDAYVVEAAPVRAARRLLNRRTRDHLLALSPCFLLQRPAGVTFLRQGWLDAEQIGPWLAHVRAVANRLARASNILEQRRALPAGYRAAPAMARRQTDLERREEEDQRVQLAETKVRRTRDMYRRAFVRTAWSCLAVAAFVFVMNYFFD